MSERRALESPVNSSRVVWLWGLCCLLGTALVGLVLVGRSWLVPAPTDHVEPRPGGTLLLVGGGITPPEVERRLVQLAGGRSARILVIPTAQALDGPLDVAALVKPWKALGAGSVRVLHATSREQADDPAFAATIREATGVWITGGNQARLARAYLDTEVETELHRLMERGGVIGGTSAGAAIMTRVMILHGQDHGDVVLGRGFDLLPDAVVDQHFLQRSRVQRLLGVLQRDSSRIGLGIDAHTALEYHAGRFRVLGKSYVMSIVTDDRGQNARIEILQPDDEFTVDELRADANAASLIGLNAEVTRSE